MTRSGVDTSIYGSHSIRGATTSKAKLKLVPISEILKKAGWSMESIFAKFYDKEIQESAQFEEAVLHQDC